MFTNINWSNSIWHETLNDQHINRLKELEKIATAGYVPSKLVINWKKRKVVSSIWDFLLCHLSETERIAIFQFGIRISDSIRFDWVCIRLGSVRLRFWNLTFSSIHFIFGFLQNGNFLEWRGYIHTNAAIDPEYVR
jgi:hypothetical protein